MAETFTFDIPAGMVLSQNDRLHPMAAHERKKYLRERGAIVQHYRKARMGRARLTVAVQFRDNRSRDPENLAPTVKSLIDGLVSGSGYLKGGLLPDDSHRYIVSTAWAPIPPPDRDLTGVRIGLTFEEVTP